MDDLISRRKAFEYFVALWECIGTIMDRDEWEDACMTTANEIPSAQEKRTDEHAETHACDCISRQAAIAHAVPLNLFGREVMMVSVSELENLPSAQPYTDTEIQTMQDLEQAQLDKAYQIGVESAQTEIIRCKDCKYHRYDGNIPYCANIDYGYGWEDNDFCSHAERREE